MKKILIISLLVFFFGSAMAQTIPPWSRPNNSYGTVENRRAVDSTIFYPTGCGGPSLRGVDLKRAAQYFDSCAHRHWVYDPKTLAWDSIHLGSVGAASGAFDGNRPITRDFGSVTGVNLGTTSVNGTLDALLYPTQNPTATLTGGGDYELHSAGIFGATLNWSGGRLASTNPLSTINVATINQSFSQPSAPGTVSGTQGVTITWNSNVTYTNTVTTTDSKVATATTSFNFYPQRYWGYTTTSPPSNVDVLTAAGGGSELTTSKAKNTFSIVVTGTNKYVFYTYPSSYGGLTSIIISGLESIGAFTQSTVSITNASGYVQNYFVYTSNNLFNNTTIAFNSVN